jgi:RNA polymerase sigma-70 factor (ECF subfamily)
MDALPHPIHAMTSHASALAILPLPSVTEHPRSKSPATEIDDALIQRFLGGDESAFLEIMKRYRGKIHATTLALLRNHADAEEITQDTFIRAHRGLATFRGDSSLSTWLYRIGMNLARNRYWYFFRRRRQDSFSLDFPLTADNSSTFCDLVADTGKNPAQEIVAQEFSSAVDRCMGELEPHHREILRLRNGLHRSYDDIATNLGINVGTVKSRIARARERLRERLGELFPEFSSKASPREWFLSAEAIYGSPAILCA